MCECIKQLQEVLSKDLKDVEMEPVNSINFETGKVISYAGRLKYSYVGLKMDGKPKKKRSDGYIIFNYCPFCGERYENRKAAACV